MDHLVALKIVWRGKSGSGFWRFSYTNRRKQPKTTLLWGIISRQPCWVRRQVSPFWKEDMQGCRARRLGERNETNLLPDTVHDFLMKQLYLSKVQILVPHTSRLTCWTSHKISYLTYINAQNRIDMTTTHAVHRVNATHTFHWCDQWRYLTCITHTIQRHEAQWTNSEGEDHHQILTLSYLQQRVPSRRPETPINQGSIPSDISLSPRGHCA